MTGTFPKSSRLVNGAQYSRVFERPRVYQDRCFRILARSSDGEDARLGLAVSKKVSREAVGRNRLKRVIRESFRQRRHDLADFGGIDIVVLPARRAATICNRELFESLAGLWQRLIDSGRRTARDQG
ncbi:ribonuclease P protein component [Marinihelvus fidelis]|uniref:Ribonuclease P protein component n=1 Tax=Marinihelvus fidelis TaxID=2613842 RepID=A0A5N0TDW4_9GAMM|nr:ribonuclease P protein component [Marinihelvus fidelis]KAA9131489.1 ribonuclease P protein component [Marinihelvus fidelis]